MKKQISLAWLLLSALNAGAEQRSQILSCPVDKGSRVALLSDPAPGGNRFHLKIDGTIGKAFTDMPDTDFTGTVVLAKCVGHTLIFAISYGPPYLKGVVIRKNPLTQSLERIDFAEKALPRWLYLNSKEMQLVIPNIGYEVSKKYLIYHFSEADGQPPEAETSDTLPDGRGRKRVEITNQSSQPKKGNKKPASS